MKIVDWNNEYKNIVSKLRLNVPDDEASAKYLDKLVNTHFSHHLLDIKEKIGIILAKPVIIVGAGPSVFKDLEILIAIFAHKVTFLAVDGTCSLFRNLNFVPDIIVSDLDGEWKAILWAITNGAMALIHAHGDNQHLVKSFFKQNSRLLKNKMIWGTTQNDLQTNLLNYGGFTDGDRAIFLAFHHQSPIISLIGFDFGEEIGKLSKMNPMVQKNYRRKIEKFKIAKHLLNSYFHIHTGIRVNLSSHGETLQGFPKTTFDNFERIIFEWYEKQNK
jgi:uncharacterized Rossmann fold enzyme